jgi:hypothetical protein
MGTGDSDRIKRNDSNTARDGALGLAPTLTLHSWLLRKMIT